MQTIYWRLQQIIGTDRTLDVLSHLKGSVVWLQYLTSPCPAMEGKLEAQRGVRLLWIHFQSQVKMSLLYSSASPPPPAPVTQGNEKWETLLSQMAFGRAGARALQMLCCGRAAKCCLFCASFLVCSFPTPRWVWMEMKRGLIRNAFTDGVGSGTPMGEAQPFPTLQEGITQV